MKKAMVISAAVCLLALAGPASAGIVFDNYPINGTVQAYNISNGISGEVPFSYSVSDSFTLSGAHLVTGVNFGAWVITGDPISTVDWSIGTTPFDNSLGSGTAAVTSSFLNVFGAYDIDSNSFSFAGIGLGPGTYYLTLQNAVTSGFAAFWDQNNGAGPDGASVDAWQGGGPGALGHLSDPGFCGVNNCAESFQIVGDTATPEPGSLMLFGSGMLLAGAWRRKSRR